MLYTATDTLLQHQGSAGAGKAAIIDGSRRVSYAELVELCRTHAGLLKTRGLKKGDRVAIFLRRSVEAVVAVFATYLAGGAAVVINETLRTRQVQYIVSHSEATVLMTDGRQLLCVPELDFDGNVILMDEIQSGAMPQGQERSVGADLAQILYTSGSTGQPKGVMVSHAGLLSGTRIVADYLKLSEDDVIISLLPFSFDYGLNQLLTAMLVGGTLVIQRSMFPADICRTLSTARVTGMAGVPTLWRQLVHRHSPFLKRTFPALRYLTNSGGGLPESIIRLLRFRHPHVELYLMYGLTEAFRSTCLPPDQVDIRPSSIGKAIPDVEIFVVNQNGRLCGPGKVGMLVHRGANIALGYWRDEIATAQVFRPQPFGRSHHGVRETAVFSGDLVTCDQEGYLYFVGRTDQLIKSRGYRISPEEIERLIAASGLVADVIAFGIPRDEVDTDIIAVVIPDNGSRVDETVLQDFCKREMPEYMRPARMCCVMEFPLTTSGKPERRELREWYVGQYQTV